MKYKNLVIVGTSHIAPESISKVQRTISQEQPEIVALELDKRRYHALLNKSDEGIELSAIRRLGLAGFAFALIGRFAQRQLGSKTGMKPGEEFLAAALFCKERRIHFTFIDQDIEVTLQRFSKAFNGRELFRLMWDLISSPFRKDEGVELINLNEIPDERLVRKIIAKVAKRYPSLYRVLVAERDEHMASQLTELMRTHQGTIVAVVGAGHQEGLLNEVKKKFRELPSYSFTAHYEQ